MIHLVIKKYQREGLILKLMGDLEIAFFTPPEELKDESIVDAFGCSFCTLYRVSI